MQKNMTWIRNRYFAHRGLFDNQIYPENSLKAFLNASEHGYDIECDIRMTKDEKMIVFHDSNTQRLTHVDIDVNSNDYDALKTLTLLKTKEHIPLLEDVLSLLPKNVHLLIELKPNANPKRMVQVFLKLMQKFDHTYAIHSYDPFIVYQFKKQAPELIRGQISETFKNKNGIKYFFLRHLLFNPFTKPDFVNYKFEDLPRKKLDRLKKKGMLILSFSARSESDLAFVRKRYDNAVFEHFKPTKTP